MRVRMPDMEARVPAGGGRSVRMLAANMDLGACYKISGDCQRASAELRGLHVETQVNIGGHKVFQRHHLDASFSRSLTVLADVAT